MEELMGWDKTGANRNNSSHAVWTAIAVAIATAIALEVVTVIALGQLC